MKKEQRMTQILLLCYLILLTWIILFKLQLPTDGWIEYRSVNLIPFGASVVIDGAIDFREIFNNVWIFLPFGITVDDSCEGQRNGGFGSTGK